jgi:hypothetical protein
MYKVNFLPPSSVEHPRKEVIFMWHNKTQFLQVQSDVTKFNNYELKGFATSTLTSEGIMGKLCYKV